LVDAGVLMFSIFMIWYGLLSFKLYRIYTVTKDVFFKYHAGSLFIIMMVFLLAAVSASSVIYLLPMWLMFAMSISVVSLYKIEKNSKLSIKKGENEFFHSKIIDNLEDFKQISDVIVANRMVDELQDVKAKAYTRDLFNSN
jgi:hypothetical protein